MGYRFELEESDFKGIIPNNSMYRARVVDITERATKQTDSEGRPIKRLSFKFRIVSDDDWDGTEVWGSTSTKFINHPNCKLKQWAEVLLGRELPPRYQLDTDHLIDRECKILVEVWKRDEKEGNQVSDLIPVPEMEPF